MAWAIPGMKAKRANAAKPARARKRRPGLLRAKYLRTLNLAASSLIDVGVRGGTDFFYETFPDKRFVLVDPQVEGEAGLRVRPGKYEFRNVALGAKPGRLEFHEAGGNSGFLKRMAGFNEKPATARREVELTTLDALIESCELQAPIGIKIDTEGYELEVLRGLRNHVKDVEFVICETSVRRRFEGGYTFAELVALMHGMGFEFFNFLNANRRHPRYYDCLFLRRDHHLFN